MKNDSSMVKLVTSTLIAITKAGDYLLTVENGLSSACDSGLARIKMKFGDSGSGDSLMKSTEERYRSDLSRSFRYSSVVLLYTIFESRSRLFIEDYQARHGAIKKSKDGTYVTKLRNMMENHSRQIIVSRSKIWDRLEDLNVVRNCIAHAGGLLRHCDRSDDVRRIATYNNFLMIDEDGYIQLDFEYSFQLYEWIYAYFTLTFSAAGYSIDMPEYTEREKIITPDDERIDLEAVMNSYYSKMGI